MNDTYSSASWSFETFELEECTPGSESERAAYDSMLKGQDKFYCAPANLEMQVSGDIQSTEFVYWMLQFRPCMDYAQYMQLTDEQRNWWEENRQHSTSP